MFTQIINNHKEQMIQEIMSALEPLNPIKPYKIVGGTNDIGFPRKTCIEKVYVFTNLYNEKILYADVFDVSTNSNHRSIELITCSLDVILSICQAVDVYLIEQKNNGRKA